MAFSLGRTWREGKFKFSIIITSSRSRLILSPMLPSFFSFELCPKKKKPPKTLLSFIVAWWIGKFYVKPDDFSLLLLVIGWFVREFMRSTRGWDRLPETASVCGGTFDVSHGTQRSLLGFTFAYIQFKTSQKSRNPHKQRPRERLSYKLLKAQEQAFHRTFLLFFFFFW